MSCSYLCHLFPVRSNPSTHSFQSNTSPPTAQYSGFTAVGPTSGTGCLIHLFIHSFRLFIQHLSSPLLLRGASDTAWILCRSFTPKRHRQLRVKDLPNGPKWRVERDSNPQSFARKATNLPMSHHALDSNCCIFLYLYFVSTRKPFPSILVFCQ